MLAVLPDLTATQVPSAGVRLAILPAYATVGEDLRRTLPGPIVEALERIVEKIQMDVFDPLLYAAESEDLRRAFGRLFPRFSYDYLSVVFLIWAQIQEDHHRFLALGMRSLEASRSLIAERGGRWLGHEAILAVHFGLHTIGVIARAAARAPDRDLAFPDPQAGNAIVQPMLAYTMAVSTVLFSLSSEEGLRGRPDKVGQLAFWSKGYAEEAYGAAKRLGLLKPQTASGPLPTASDAEDILLANAGLEDYARLLAAEEER
jgi:hypothetical protein